MATNPTAQQFGTIQDASVEIAQDFKELYGQNKAPDDVTTARLKITGKVKFGKIEVETFNQLMFGEPALITGVKIVVPNEGPTLIPTTPFTITVVNGGAGAFFRDLGVIFAATGAPLQTVASAPAVGQYSVTTATGVYLFNTGDTGKTVKISYVYTDAVNGKTLLALNRPMGYGPSCEMFLMNPYQGTKDALRLFQSRFAKISLPIKNDDYITPEMDFAAYPDVSGNLFEWYQTAG